MPDAPQLMYTAARTPRAAGYQFVAETPGVASEERDLIERHSSPSGPLTETCNFDRATLVYALPTGRIAISRLANVGPGYDGRPNGICTRTAVLQAADFHAMGGRLSWIADFLEPTPEARGVLAMLELPDVEALPPVRFEALPEWMESPQTAAQVLRALLSRHRVVLIEPPGGEDRLDALEVLITVLPGSLRESFSLSTFDVESNPDRAFSLSVLPESASLGEASSQEVTVARLRGAEPVHLSPSPYADFVVTCIYGGELGPLRAFRRFVLGVGQTPATVDDLLAYWQKLETPRSTNDPVHLAALDLDLAEMALTAAPGRAISHLEHAAARATRDASPGMAGRALFRILPYCNFPGGSEEIRRLAEKFIEPFVEAKDLTPLCSILAQEVAVAADPSGPVQMMLYGDVLRAALDVANSPHAFPVNPQGRVNELERVLEALQAGAGTATLQAQVALAMAGLPSPSDRELTKSVAGRLFRLAEQHSAESFSDRLFQVASALYHQVGEVVEEVRSEARRITLRVRSEAPWDAVALKISLSQLVGNQGPTAAIGPTPDGDAASPERAVAPASGSIGGTIRSLSAAPPPDVGRVYRYLSDRVGEPPASVGRALEVFLHTHEHPPADMAQVTRILALAFKKVDRFAEGLLFLALIPPPELIRSSGTSEGLLPTVEEGLLQLSAASKPGLVSPAVSLWAVGTLLAQTTDGSWPASAQLSQWLEGRFTSLAQDPVPATGLTLWDGVVIAGLSPRYAGTPAPDLSQWLKALSSNDQPLLGASPSDLRGGLAAVRSLVEALATANAASAADPGTGRVQQRLRSAGYQRGLRQLDLLEREIERGAVTNPT